MSDQAILVQMLGDIQTRLGRIESTQSDIQQEVASVSTRVAVVETHCKESCGPKGQGATTTTLLGLPPVTWLRYAAVALFAAYMMGTASSQAKRTDSLADALKRAKIKVDSLAPAGN